MLYMFSSFHIHLSAPNKEMIPAYAELTIQWEKINIKWK